MRRGAVAVACLAASGCPGFGDGPFACPRDGRCEAPLVCAHNGLCCPEVACAGLCGMQTNDCGATRDCGACCGPIDCAGTCGAVTNACGDTAECGPCSFLTVDARAPRGGDGTPARPLSTISEALARAESSTVVRSIRVASGSYANERFPLVIRGISVEGAGEVVLAGQGAWTASIAGELRTPRVTVVIGDHARPSRLSGVRFHAAEADTAILCDRGDSGDRDAPLPEPNTTLGSIAIDGAYPGASLIANDSCNLRLEHATILGPSDGVFLTGDCWRSLRPALRAFDVTIDGATKPSKDGSGFLVWDCIRRLELDRVLVRGCERGVAAIQHEADVDAPGFRPNELYLRSSQLIGNGTGLAVYWSARVTELRDSELRDNGVAVLVAPAARPEGAPSPAIALARDNRVVENLIGVLYAADPRPSTHSDWGRPDDPGGNTFRCNAGDGSPDGYGMDWFVDTAHPALSVAGNTWDHAPPTRRARFEPSADDGLDLYAPLGGAIDVSGARAGADACAAPRKPGPP